LVPRDSCDDDRGRQGNGEVFHVGADGRSMSSDIPDAVSTTDRNLVTVTSVDAHVGQ
jgi:hypothetical protein